MDDDIEAAALLFVRGFFAGDATGHDVWHTIRVHDVAIRICDTERTADRQTVAVAALLHDVDDRKLGGDADGLPNAKSFLRAHGATAQETEKICRIVSQVSFKGSDSVMPDTVEGKIVQDADRLDAIGAIGIARVFAYGGAHGRPICDPYRIPKGSMTATEYYSSGSDSVGHFYEKLLHLKDMMGTSEGRRLAESRDAYLRSFLDEFNDEWHGLR